MLSPEHRAIVKATVPLLETGGEALTTHFYRSLLQEHPEMLPFFNQAHQQSGQQQRALANGVLMYAKNIDQLEKLGDLVGTIVAKHVSLQIRPEHYPVVGGCLLRSIRAVLGADIATDAVIEAWGAAYGQLADILIGVEKVAYDQMAEQPGGWRGERSFVVVSRRMESTEIVSLRLVPEDGAAIAAHLPGQFIGLRLLIDGQDVRRNYSLSAAFDGSTYRISVKREDAGLVSRYLHDTLKVGDRLALFPPAGRFVLQASGRPLVLITGGVGITPAIAMLQDVVATSARPVVFIHAARNAEVHAFRDWTDAVARLHPQVQCFYIHDVAGAGERHADAAPHATGLLDQDRLAGWLPQDRDVDAYYLGPTPFMRSVKKSLAALGVPAAQTFHEFFGPASALD